MDRYESSSLRFLLNADTATKIPDNIMVNVVLIDVWPVFGSGANGTSPSSIKVTSTGDSGRGANGTSSGVMVVKPGPPGVLV